MPWLLVCLILGLTIGFALGYFWRLVRETLQDHFESEVKRR